MANDCLKTKLKASVNNDSLPELGTLIFKVANNNGNKQRIFGKLNPVNSTKTIKVTTDNGNFYHGDTDLGNEETLIPYGSALEMTTTANATVRLFNKYNLAQLYINKYDGADGSIARVPSVLHFQPDFVFNIEELTYCTYLTEFNGEADLKGDIVRAFGNLSTMTILRLYCGALTGDIKDLVGKFIANSGTQSGTIPTFGLRKLTSGLYDRNTDWKITFNGKDISTPSVSESLVWESASKIYIHIKSNNKIICIGYSDADIATNTASGGIWEGIAEVIKYD